MSERTVVSIEGMTCQHCVRAVEQALEELTGVESSDVAIGSATVRYDASAVGTDAILDAIADAGYSPALAADPS